MKYDFSGYVTRTGIKCTDGRTIGKDAFKHNDGQTVPMVWQHLHNDPDNVLGHVLLENRDDGVYGYGLFNGSRKGLQAKQLVAHGDVDSMSIFANKLQQRGGYVEHGDIIEVSLVLAGANRGAKIDNVCIAHSDGTSDEVEDEAIITTGGSMEMYKEPELAHADEEGSEETVGDVFNTLSEKQKNVVYAMIAEIMENQEAKHSDEEDGEEFYEEEEDDSMKHNAFDQIGTMPDGVVLTHDQVREILKDAKTYGSLKDSFLAHAENYGIDPIDILFPDAKAVGEPETIKRDTEWVTAVINAAHHTPFSRLKSITFDITADEARAKGYVTGALKKEEVITASKRETTPTTIYKKQKLDRDDLLDITDFGVVSYLKNEMRTMLNEELARAVLLGDGRTLESPDKISETNIRPIYKDVPFYAKHVVLDKDDDVNTLIKKVILARKDYRGSGNPTMFTTTDTMVDILLDVDKIGRRLYQNEGEVASALRCSKIVEVPVMENVSRVETETKSGKLITRTYNLLGIMVNMKDYTIGADKGGEINMFDDFDIDYNQYKYLIETRCSGALTVPASAIILERHVSTTETDAPGQ